ncbi:hypothetical protein K488DRAFT_89450 [Vararia minispora EC-137]|uniref:Uncharacterized protein n=1 Tax=Vararia minispora EC-137 TaxID=1314806 RepID=A0ACB8QAN7_9AGAM|nr:hypothetical protein K488DRAFT_89450 [Vararia minispora EC-137]
MPDVRRFVSSPRYTDGDIDEVFRAVHIYANNARQDDTSSLRKSISGYIYRHVSVDPPFADKKKADRGFQHAQLARLLCPVELLERYDQDPLRTTQELQAGKISCAIGDDAENWSLIFFKGYQYNSEKPLDGLLDPGAEVFFRSFLRIFFGEHAAAHPASFLGAKRGIANKNGMNDVSPRTLGYVCVQALFALCHIDQWQSRIGTLSLPDLYNVIVTMLEMPDDETAKDIRKAWNIAIFGHEDGRQGQGSGTMPAGNEQASSPPPLNRFQLARLARNEQAKILRRRTSKESSQLEPVGPSEPPQHNSLPHPMPSTQEPSPRPPSSDVMPAQVALSQLSGAYLDLRDSSPLSPNTTDADECLADLPLPAATKPISKPNSKRKRPTIDKPDDISKRRKELLTGNTANVHAASTETGEGQAAAQKCTEGLGDSQATPAGSMSRPGRRLRRRK